MVTPALIDCHTHLVYGGSRATEFELRLQGASYEEIAKNGGGILSTVKATREASEDKLLAQALPRLDALLAEGVGTIEIKSGYGLDIETEIKMLRVARQLGKERNVRVKTTFLGAHAIPPEFLKNLILTLISSVKRFCRRFMSHRTFRLKNLRMLSMVFAKTLLFLQSRFPGFSKKQQLWDCP